MSYYEIPLTCAPDCYQSFTLTMNESEADKENITLELRLRYLDRYDIWLADVRNLATNAVLCAGVPLVLGVNLLGQAGYLGAGEAYVMQALPTELEHPDNKTLGSTFVLVWGDDS